MSSKILWVDDEPRVLDAIRRLLRGQFDSSFVGSGPAALETLAADGPFAVVVSDMRMPGMTGIELLERVREIAPDTVRMMLTGNADQATAAEAVNLGQVFRFLTKPCTPELLTEALSAATAQYRLVTAERDLLERTVRGAIQALTSLLSLERPEVFGKVDRLLGLVSDMVEASGERVDWMLETAVRLSPISGLGLAPELLERVTCGGPLTEAETLEQVRNAGVGADVVAAIPRLEQVAESLRWQFRRFDGGEPPAGGPRGKDIPLGARLLRVASAYDAFRSAGFTHAAAVAELQSKKGVFDAELLALLRPDNAARDGAVSRVEVDKIQIGMTVEEDVRADHGPLLLCRGQQVTSMLVERLRALCQAGAVPKTLLVRSPPADLTGQRL